MKTKNLIIPAFLLLMLSLTSAYAAERVEQCPSPMPDDAACLTFTVPDQTVAGDPAPPSRIAAARVYLSPAQTQGARTGSTEVPLEILQGVTEVRVLATLGELGELPPGPGQQETYSFEVTVVDTDGRESGFSNALSKTFVGPPTELAPPELRRLR